MSSTQFSPFQTLLLQQQKSLPFSLPHPLASLRQFNVQVHHSVSLKISCVMDKQTALMDLTKQTVWLSVKTQVSLGSTSFITFTMTILHCWQHFFFFFPLINSCLLLKLTPFLPPHQMTSCAATRGHVSPGWKCVTVVLTVLTAQMRSSVNQQILLLLVSQQGKIQCIKSSLILDVLAV